MSSQLKRNTSRVYVGDLSIVKTCDVGSRIQELNLAIIHDNQTSANHLDYTLANAPAAHTYQIDDSEHTS